MKQGLERPVVKKRGTSTKGAAIGGRRRTCGYLMKMKMAIQCCPLLRD